MSEEIKKKIEIKACPVTYTMSIIGGKWKVIILYLISLKMNRFGIMLKTMMGVSKYILTKQLRELEKDEVISRVIYPEVPPRVEYFLTEKGKSLLPIISSMETWGKKHKK